MAVFPTTNTTHHTKRNMFFDQGVDVARYDVVRYPQFEKLTDKQNGFFWKPEEVDLSRDSKDFKTLTDHEKHIFTSNLKRQILLDSVQGRAPSLAFLPICSVPELETWIQTWTFFETIHSRSYTHIIRNVYPDPSKVFDDMMDIEEIVNCAKDISKYYDELIFMNQARGAIPKTYEESPDAQRHHKKALWLCLNAVNALEGVRFYVSFACSWAFAEVKKMEGNATIIKFIARDENVHLASTQQIIKLLPKEDKDFREIQEETKHEVEKMFLDVVEQEKAWAKYLFKDGSIIGLNEKLLFDYIDWISQKRMAAIGIGVQKNTQNPLPWTQRWIAGQDVQPAPQETSISSYVIGAVKQDVTKDTFKGFAL